MFDTGSVEREIYDQLMLDRSIRAKFDPQELEDFIDKIATPFRILVHHLNAEVQAIDEENAELKDEVLRLDRENNVLLAR